jgi:hypothetical protein
MLLCCDEILSRLVEFKILVNWGLVHWDWFSGGNRNHYNVILGKRIALPAFSLFSLQGVPKKTKTIEINVLSEFECLGLC